MYSFNDLKPQLKLSPTKVSCPVLGCTNDVDRQHRVFRTVARFTCGEHRIHIGPSTFQYCNPEGNLLWVTPEERALLAVIKGNKREDRMARERSEDALTWNVFRGLETTGWLTEWLTSMLGHAPTGAAVHYWSCNAATGKTWAPLADARHAFAEAENRGSEPDVIIETPEVDIWVEAKFGSNNDTKPSDVDGARKRYSQDRADWYKSVCKKDFKSIAVDAKRYELLRLWLLGSHAANVRKRRFLFVNLVREGQAKDIEEFADTAFRQDDSRRFVRVTWEGIANMLERDVGACAGVDGADGRVAGLVEYMRTRTLGYDGKGRLVRAFKL
jgi:hypothetical protein